MELITTHAIATLLAAIALLVQEKETWQRRLAGSATALAVLLLALASDTLQVKGWNKAEAWTASVALLAWTLLLRSRAKGSVIAATIGLASNLIIVAWQLRWLTGKGGIGRLLGF